MFADSPISNIIFYIKVLFRTLEDIMLHLKFENVSCIFAGFSVIDICVLPICVTLFRSLRSGLGGAIITGDGTNDPKSPTCAVGIG